MARDNERPARGNDGAGRRENNRFSSDRPRNDRGEKKIFNRRDKYEDTDRRSFNSERGEEGERRSFRDRREGGEKRDFNREDRGERRSFNREDRGERRNYSSDRNEGGERRSFNPDRRNSEGRSFGNDRPAFKREDSSEESGVKKFSFKRGNEEREERGGFKPRREEGQERNYNRGERRSFNSDRGERKPYNDRREGGERRSFGERTERDERRNYSSDRREDRRGPREEGGEERRSFRNDREDRKPFNREERGEKRSFNREDRGERRNYSSDRNEGGERRPFKSDRRDNREERPFRREERSFDGEKRNFKSDRGGKFNSRDRRTSFSNREELGEPETPNYNTKHYENNPRIKKSNRKEENDGTIRLNRYIANAGICSRREADTLIESGEIKVNGQVVTEMGFKVRPEDTVQYGKKILNREKLVYVLLNKPKDFLTTTDDPEGRKTVMSLVEKASNERIFPVGRLDRNTTGLLLFTNDGELAQKLTHPSNGVKKIYQVELDKQITKEDFLKVAEGVELEDGKAEVDDVAMIGDTGKFLGLEIHIGRNRIVRRIFEHLGYEVVSLDRVQYAGLTKKDLPRGNWRYLSEKELIRLKYFM
ncbi:pseudouridine synthase [Pontibacter sp. Tf4]|uniref:pseudouridine synthase n=1 Tax=Pontibacter sp. Tf4 TaxID=2761620 RepID=UPI0016273461|nr:pseudouridine synthase [Pontibacter sp. Tf4]MBB6609541.1 pseudouridine synthase [Pontibacter sp. Tf4]